MGKNGSYIADIFYQSVGLVSLLIPFSLFFTGISITINKKLILLIENIFFIILYILISTLFFSIFHKETYWLVMNGNNGFVGDLLSQTIFIDILNINKDFSYYLLIIFIILLFLLSSDFKLSYVKKFFYFVINLFSRNTKIIDTDKKVNENELKDEVVNHNNVDDVIKNYTKKVTESDQKTVKLLMANIDLLQKVDLKEKFFLEDKLLNELLDE